MTQININVGTGPNTGDADDLRTAFQATQANFTELYGTTASLSSGKVDKGVITGSGLTLTGPAILGRSASGPGAIQVLDSDGAKAILGLSNVNNTSDANKPVSTAMQTALDLKEPAITPGTTGQYWKGDKTWATLNKSAVGLGNVDNTADTDKPLSSAATTALAGKANSVHTHVAADIQFSAGPRMLGKTSAGAGAAAELTDVDVKTFLNLTNVNNTSDANKPVSTATQTALDLKLDKTGTITISQVTNLQTALDGKASAVHTHTTSDISGLSTALAGKEPSITAGTTSQYWRGDKSWQTLATVATSGSYADLTNKPSLFSGSYSDLTNKPSLSTVATSGAIADTTGFLAVTRLDPGTDGQFLSVVGGVATWVAAPSGGSGGPIAISDVTGLQTELDSKADATHTRVIADVTGLQTALDTLQDNIDAKVIPHSVVFYWDNTPTLQLIGVVSDNFTVVPANCAAKALVAATAETVFVIMKNDTNVGTITWEPLATEGTVAFTTPSDADFVKGDIITIALPVVSDDTLNKVGIVLHS